MGTQLSEFFDFIGLPLPVISEAFCIMIQSLLNSAEMHPLIFTQPQKLVKIKGIKHIYGFWSK